MLIKIANKSVVFVLILFLFLTACKEEKPLQHKDTETEKINKLMDTMAFASPVETKSIIDEPTPVKVEAPKIKKEKPKPKQEKPQIIYVEKEDTSKNLMEEAYWFNKRKDLIDSEIDVQNFKIKKHSEDNKDVISVESSDDDELSIAYVNNYDEIQAKKNIASSKVDRTNILTADMYIAGILETSISSRKAGIFNIFVDEDIRSMNANNILIPRGTKIVCQSQENSAYGEVAVNAKCERGFLPNGKSFFFSGILHDQMGRPGMIGDVDNRIFEKYGEAIVLTLLSGGAAYVNATALADKPEQVIINEMSSSMSDVTKEVLKNTIKLAPIITVPSGTRIIIRTGTDIYLSNEEGEQK